MFIYRYLYFLSLVLSLWNISVYAVNIGHLVPDFTLFDTSQEPYSQSIHAGISTLSHNAIKLSRLARNKELQLVVA